TWEDGQIVAFGAEPKTVAGVETLVEQTVGVPMAELLALDERRRNGEAIQRRLDQLHLTNPAFVYLLRLRELVAAAQPVTRDEWESFFSILVRVRTRRLTAQWRDEERAAGVTLSPDFFVPLSGSMLVPLPPVLAWRMTQDERFDWL